MQHRAELGQHARDGGPSPTEMIIIGTSALREKNPARWRTPCAVPSTPSSTVAPASPCATQRLDDRHVRRPPAHAVLAADVDRELGRLMQLVGELDGADPSSEHAGALERHQAVAGDGRDVVQRGFDAPAGVDRDRDDRQILRERQQARGLEVVLDAEALDPAHHDARLKRAPLVEVDQRIGEKRAVRAIALPEVRRQLQAIVDHDALPTSVGIRSGGMWLSSSRVRRANRSHQPVSRRFRRSLDPPPGASSGPASVGTRRSECQAALRRGPPV